MKSNQRERPLARGIGLAATVPLDLIVEAARAAEHQGYSSFWLNVPGGGDPLEALGRVAQAVPRIRLGVGVIPLSRASPEQIVEEVLRQHLPPDRLYLGLGTGAGGNVDRVEEAIAAVRTRLGVQIVVAALGPKMCRMAGRYADGVLLNWLTPVHAARSVERVREAAREAGRPVPRLMAYVRAALGRDARVRLEMEAGRYESSPHYASHFERMRVDAMGTCIVGETEAEIRSGLSQWDGVLDEVVLRLITAHDTVEEVTRLIDLVRPVP